jgi:16S rRNA (uracil1498-N3)-methyltransferase
MKEFIKVDVNFILFASPCIFVDENQVSMSYDLSHSLLHLPLMSIPYFYEPFSDVSHIVLSENSVHHALHVLRMKTGSELFVTNGRGEAARCSIIGTSKKDCHIEVVESPIASSKQQASKLHIAISFTKNPARIEWFLEKATEIGIQAITPLITKRSEKIHFKKERFEKIMVSAMLQSQQTFLPTLHEATLLEDVIKGIEQVKCIAHCEEDKVRIQLKDGIQPQKDTLILIGPEGDFTPEEIHLCLQQQCKPVSLGRNRLRTETAGLFACVVFNAQIATI